MERVARRAMKLPVNSLLNAALLSGQGAALIAESIIGWPLVSND